MATHALITRRTLAATLAAVPAAAMAGPLATDARHDDAELLELGRQWETAVAATETAAKVVEAGIMSEDEFDNVHQVENDLQIQIVCLPGQTIEGLKLKARVAKRLSPDVNKECQFERAVEYDGPCSDVAAAFALVRDLLAMEAAHV
jgi:hypothetical protein